MHSSSIPTSTSTPTPTLLQFHPDLPVLHRHRPGPLVVAEPGRAGERAAADVEGHLVAGADHLVPPEAPAGEQAPGVAAAVVERVQGPAEAHQQHVALPG